MLKRVTFLMTLLVGCHPYWSKVLSGKPDLQMPRGPAVYMHGLSQPTHLATQLEIIHQRALAICPEAHRASLQSRWAEMLIEWESVQKFSDGNTGCCVVDCGREVNGCQPSDYFIEVDEVEALPDELGHVVFEECFGTTGEQELPDAGSLYDSDFATWTGETRAAILTLDQGASPMHLIIKP